MHSNISNSTPLAMLSVGDFVDILRSQGLLAEPKRTATRIGYGIHSIQREFNVSHNTALKYKDTFLAPAIDQAAPGHKVKVDLDYARELYNKAMNKYSC